MMADVKKMIEVLGAMSQEIPLADVIEALSGHKVLPFDARDKRNVSLMKDFERAAEDVVAEVNKVGIKRPRPNEVGNDIEGFVKDALKGLGCSADVPRCKDGTKKSVGYPDIEVVDEFGRTHYIECKTYNIRNVSTTQRSFYLSPSDNFKVTKDAYHFVMSFETYVSHSEGSHHVYKCRHWKIVDVWDLTMDVKFEFNSDNKRLYAGRRVISQG